MMAETNFPEQAYTSIETVELNALRARISQLEAQRGGSMDLTEDALSLACGCELPPVEGVDAIKFGLRSSLRSGYRNGWRDACAKMQRGGAVVVPAWMDDDDWEAIGFQQSTEGQLQRVWDRAVSRIQPIPAAKVLADGMVGVDRKGLQDVYEALAYSQPSKPSVDPHSNSMSHRRALGFCADALRSAKGEVE